MKLKLVLAIGVAWCAWGGLGSAGAREVTTTTITCPQTIDVTLTPTLKGGFQGLGVPSGALGTFATAVVSNEINVGYQLICFYSIAAGVPNVGMAHSTPRTAKSCVRNQKQNGIDCKL